MRIDWSPPASVLDTSIKTLTKRDRDKSSESDSDSESDDRIPCGDPAVYPRSLSPSKFLRPQRYKPNKRDTAVRDLLSTFHHFEGPLEKDVQKFKEPVGTDGLLSSRPEGLAPKVKIFQEAQGLLKRYGMTKPRQASDLTKIYRKRYGE
jgi:hypothetical protein